MRTLVGQDRRDAVNELVGLFDAVAAGRGPVVVSIEGPLGLGKTRLAQELYGRLAVSRQPGQPYWPPRLDWRDAADPSARPDLLQARKQVEPTPGWVIPGGTDIPWLWWGVTCQLSNSGSPMRALKDASDQLRAHLDPLLARLQRANHNRDDALMALAGVFDLVGVVNPGAVVDAGSKFLDIFKRRNERKEAAKAVAMDRRLEVTGESFAEAGRIAEGLAAVAKANTPTVLVIDDAQWADAGLVSLLRYIGSIEAAPILVVTTAWSDALAGDTPAGPETFTGWLRALAETNPGRVRRLRVDRLDAAALGEMILDIAPRTAAAAVERIATIASGNPLVLNLLLDVDLIRRDISADGRIDTDPAKLSRLPSNLHAIYLNLWNQLPTGVRSTLALASIQGPEFLPGIIEGAAIRLGMRNELVAGLAAARDMHHWVRPVNDDRYEFTERQRFEIAFDIVREVFDEDAEATIRGAIIDHILELKASARWADLDNRTRRLALESHLDLNEELGESAARDLGALADSMLQLASLELEAGNAKRAVELVEGSLSIQTALPADESLLLAARSLLVESLAAAGIRRDAPAPAIDSASPVAGTSAASPSVATSDPRPASATAGHDEYGRIVWTGWAPRAVPDLTAIPPSEVAELLREVVAAEGPCVAGRAYRLLSAGSGAGRQGRRIRSALDSGVRSATRRGMLVASIADAKGASDRRILRLPDHPDFVLRMPGDRTLEEMPATEVVELARSVLRREPNLDGAALRRRLASLLGVPGIGRSFDDALERLLADGPTEGGAPEAADNTSPGGGPVLDEWGREPWIGWTVQPVPVLMSLKPAQVAAHIAEVVEVEGPVVVGRVTELLRQASGAPRTTKSLRDVVEGGLMSGVRTGTLVLARGRHGYPETRVVRLAAQPEVRARTAGDRGPDAIPPAELAELAHNILAAEPALDRGQLKRRAASVIGWSRYTQAIDEVIERALPVE